MPSISGMFKSETTSWIFWLSSKTLCVFSIIPPPVIWDKLLSHGFSKTSSRIGKYERWTFNNSSSIVESIASIYSPILYLVNNTIVIGFSTRNSESHYDKNGGSERLISTDNGISKLFISVFFR